MRKSVLHTLILIFIAESMTNFGHAFDLDMTVDDEIRKNYNPYQLINDVNSQNKALAQKVQTTSETEKLPELPNINKINNNKTQKFETKQKATSYNIGNVKIKKGTTFLVNNQVGISDWQKKGTIVKFITNNAYSSKKYQLPESTTFIGEIVESHPPQISCNGGLVAIKIKSLIYKGQTIPINAYVIRANDKKIFFNTIKGNRTYLKTVWKKGNWGRVLFDKMLSLTASLGTDGSTIILSPFPLAYGTICLGANTLISPISAFFSKGGHVSIPANSSFKIKLEEDAFIN